MTGGKIGVSVIGLCFNELNKGNAGKFYSPQIFIDPVSGYLAIIYPEIISRANIAALVRRERRTLKSQLRKLVKILTNSSF